MFVKGLFEAYYSVSLSLKFLSKLLPLLPDVLLIADVDYCLNYARCGLFHVLYTIHYKPKFFFKSWYRALILYNYNQRCWFQRDNTSIL